MDMSSATSTAENGLKRKYSELQQLQIIVEDSEEEILLTSYRNNEAQGTEGADAVPRTGWYREINKDKQILGSTGFHPRPTHFEELAILEDSWTNDRYSLGLSLDTVHEAEQEAVYEKPTNYRGQVDDCSDSHSSPTSPIKRGVFFFQHSPTEYAKPIIVVDSPISCSDEESSTDSDSDSLMHQDASSVSSQLSELNSTSQTDASVSSNPNFLSTNAPLALKPTSPLAPHELKWDWSVEHADRQQEARADKGLHNATPFQVDRRVLKDVVLEKMGVEVARINFLSSGTFHKAYLITLVDGVELVARVARRFMPKLKTESEVATMAYLRENTNVPVPVVYHYDANPYNRLGGEYILMSKAKGTPLSTVFHGMSYTQLVQLTHNLAALMIPLFAHRFDAIGSLYSGPNPRDLASPTSRPSNAVTPSVMTPKAVPPQHSSFPFASFSSLLLPIGHATPSSLGPDINLAASTAVSSGGVTPIPPFSTAKPSVEQPEKKGFHVGPMISWPFFGSNRGELAHPAEIDRGPWPSTHDYIESCVKREVSGVVLENEGKTAPHRLHLDPDEILSSRHHHLNAVPGDESDDSDEYDLEESEEECQGPGANMYRDYRSMQRSTFLVAHLKTREETVRNEMGRWKCTMERLVELTAAVADELGVDDDNVTQVEGDESMDVDEEFDDELSEGFSLDCHDLSLENVFVDAEDPTKITCVIDWESTTIRPLWQCAHLPAFLQSSPFTANLFRKALSAIASGTCPAIADSLKSIPPASQSANIRSASYQSLAQQWLFWESIGTRLRMCHRVAEWDGWEEGLADGILGPEEHDEEWYKNLIPSSALAAYDGLKKFVIQRPSRAAIAKKRRPFKDVEDEDDADDEHELEEGGAAHMGPYGQLSPPFSPYMSPPMMEMPLHGQIINVKSPSLSPQVTETRQLRSSALSLSPTTTASVGGDVASPLTASSTTTMLASPLLPSYAPPAFAIATATATTPAPARSRLGFGLSLMVLNDVPVQTPNPNPPPLSVPVPALPLSGSTSPLSATSTRDKSISASSSVVSLLSIESTTSGTSGSSKSSGIATSQAPGHTQTTGQPAHRESANKKVMLAPSPPRSITTSKSRSSSISIAARNRRSSSASKPNAAAIAAATGLTVCGVDAATATLRKLSTVKLPFDKEKEKEQVLDTTGDICGGRGGELGRRLEAWLVNSGAGEDGERRE